MGKTNVIQNGIIRWCARENRHSRKTQCGTEQIKVRNAIKKKHRQRKKIKKD